MKLSIFTSCGNEYYDGVERGDLVDEAISCYLDLADEVIVIDGHGDMVSDNPKLKIIYYNWPWIWDWTHLPKAFNLGYKACTGDWVIRADIDYIFHEEDMEAIRKKLEIFMDMQVVTFQKFCFVTKDKFYEKGEVPLAINKRLVGDQVLFGKALNVKTDLCYPIRVTGEDAGIPVGQYEPELFAKSAEPVYVYDYSFKTEEQTREEFWRFSQAYHKVYEDPDDTDWKFGNSEHRAFEKFIGMMKGRLRKCVYTIGEEKNGLLYTHPKYIKSAIGSISEDKFAYNGFGLL
jgi:glycosyltransferase involved in cell wall biosynthesis